jgi:hypothetical protein
LERVVEQTCCGRWKIHQKEYKRMGITSADRILLYDPATEEEIQAAEAEVGELPADFKEMLRLANG